MNRGFTLIETVVAVTFFVLVTLALYNLFTKIVEVTSVVRVKTVAATLVNEQFERVRNMPYTSVGTIGGIPVGVLEQEQDVERSGNTFTVVTTVRNIDDPFDGTLGGTPNDSSPADSKLVQIDVSCATCKNFSPLSFSTRVAPKNLETASTNGALVIRVYDASGQPVPQADVHITNDLVDPAVDITDTTNNSGTLTIVDAPPSIEGYRIVVSKDGYSTDQTYETTTENQNPTKPFATVVEQQVTQVSFAIDQLSTLSVTSVSPTCDPVGSVDFHLTGAKLIGTNPNIRKYSQGHTTNASGSMQLTNLEWDTYDVTVPDLAYDLTGMNPLLPLVISPGSAETLQLIVIPEAEPSLLVTVVDAGSRLPITDATVTIDYNGEPISEVTGQGVFQQTDWSGGAGQELYTDQTRYFNSDGNIATNNPTGEMKLQTLIDEFTPSGWLISSTFDTGSESNFHEVRWEPASQPIQTGAESVRFQVATNNDGQTWAYFGPDGTSSSYYTTANRALYAGHDGDRYVRYRAELQTADTAYTPNISDTAITFTSSCTPPGQVIFQNLAVATYEITVESAGYQTYSGVVSINNGWQQETVELNPS